MWSYKQRDPAEQGCTLITRAVNVAAFVEELTRQIDILSTRHFIAKSTPNSLPFLMQISFGSRYRFKPLLVPQKKYSFHVQDSVQGHHWDNSHVALHPFAVHCIDEVN